MSDCSRDLSDCSSVEYEVLKWANGKLCTGYRCAHKSLCRLFYSKDLLTTQVEHMCSDNKVDIDTFVHTMVNSLQDRVRIDPSAFYTILGILETERGLSHLADTLKERMIVEEEKMAESIHAERQREHRIMDVRKRNSRLVRRQRRKDLFISEREATNRLPRSQEERNASAFGPAGNGAMEYVSKSPQTESFGDQKNASSTDGGDILYGPGRGRKNFPKDKLDGSPFMKPQHISTAVKGEEEVKMRRELRAGTGAEKHPKFNSRRNYGLLPSNTSFNQPPSRSTICVTDETGENRVSQSTTIDTGATTDNVSEYEKEANSESEYGGGEWENEERDDSRSQGEILEDESTCESWNNMDLGIPDNSYGRFRRSSSIVSDTSDTYETPTLSLSSINFSSKKERSCGISQLLLRTRLNELEEGEKEKLELDEKERQPDGTHMDYDTKNREMVPYTRKLQSKVKSLTELVKMTEEDALRSRLISEHEHKMKLQEKTKEVTTLKKKLRRTETEKELAEMDRDVTEKERDLAEKERDDAEKERDLVEKERDMERKIKLEADLLQVGQSKRRAKSLVDENELKKYLSQMGTNTNQ